MPASDVSAWAKAASKPSYTAAEVGASASGHNHDSSYLGISAKAADSDKLDGYHATDFAGSVHGHSVADITIGGRPFSVGGTNLLKNTEAGGVIGTSNPGESVYTIGTVPLTAGADYTLSGNWWKEVNCKGIQILAISVDYSNVFEIYGNSNSMGQNLVSTFTVPGVYTGNYYIRIDNEGSSNGISAGLWWSMLKLEKGTVATAWSPAPQDVTLAAYPVGSIYMSISSTSPATLFGGTWGTITDRFLLGAGGSYSVGALGGAATHTLSISEMPSHSHQWAAAGVISPSETPQNWDDIVGGSINALGTGPANPDLESGAGSNAIKKRGGGAAHNNMPPYYAVYMWQRTA